MELPKSLTIVTNLSKTLALLIFIILPFVGFFLGYRYRQLTFVYPPATIHSNANIQQIAPTLDQISRCGDIPIMDDYFLYSNSFIKSNVGWSPDCRHIAWSSFSLPFTGGWLGEEDFEPQNEPTPTFTPKNYEGIFVYNDCTKKIIKIFIPKTETAYNFGKWLDNYSFTYEINNQQYLYSLVDSSSQLFTQ